MNDFDLISLPERFLSADSKAIITNSLSLSKSFRIAHERLLRYIEKTFLPPELTESNFQKYEHEGKPAYKLTRDGMLFVVMQLPGREAALFRLAYLNAFNEMSQKHYRPEKVEKLTANLQHLKQDELKAVMLSCLQLIK